MHFTRLLRYLTLAALLAGTVQFGSATAADKKNEGFTELFNGKDLTGWKAFLVNHADPAKTWSVKDGMIVCTGHPNGFLYTDGSYKNYILLYDWRYQRPAGLTNDNQFKGNSGCLVNIHNPEKPVMSGVWPECCEVQGMNLEHGRLLFIPRKIGKGTFDRAAKDKAVRPVGEWNTTEITCKDDGSISAKINGIPVSSGKGQVTEGHIGFQSEGAEISFRHIKLKQIQ
jgi:Domain of Unknown Function (DUF1080)